MVYDIAWSKGFDEDKLKIYIGHCIHHLQNVWVGAISVHLCCKLTQLLKDYLILIPYHLHATYNLSKFLCCDDKECNFTANYAKDHGDQFHYYMECYYPVK
eukprot:8812910-Ditylum_brightwellii.AAC.1